MARAGADVVGIDWHVALDDARTRLGPDVAVQGNLDPDAVLCGWDVTRVQADAVLAANAGRPGHIFNLGHGVLPETDPGVLTQLVAHVHEVTAR